MADGPWLVVGLGNPGEKYARTRHNIGADVVSSLAADAGDRLSGNTKTRSDLCRTRLAGESVILAVPRSYMNESGGPVRALCDYYSVSVDRLVVVHDELDIGFGQLKVKRGGGDGGHNGLRSVRAALGTGEFLRVRVGIGRPPGRQDPADFVLKPFGPQERDEVPLLIADAGEAVESLIARGLEATQNTVHGRGPADGQEA